MNQKKLILLILLAIFIGLPILGTLHGAVQRAQLNSGVVPPMMDTKAETAVSMGRVTGAPTGVNTVSSDIAMPIMPPVPIQDGFVPGESRVIVKNANLSLVVEDIRSAVSAITNLTKNNNGYVTSASMYQNSYVVPMNKIYQQNESLAASMTLRIPADKLEDVLDQVRKLSLKVVQDEVTASDQTKQKVDLEAQLKNLRATEAQLQAIMKQAKTVQDTLEVQQQLSSVRSQIEVLDAELQNLTNNAAMSNVSISLNTKEADQPVVTPQQNSLMDELKLALRDTLRVYRNLFISGMRVALLVVPLLIIGGLAWFGWQRLARKS